jgi:hypothetical protein
MTLSKSVLGSVAAVSLSVISAFATVPAQTSSCSYMFNTNLRLGAVSTDVQNLQKLLNMDAATKVASAGAGSMGYETLRFGPATLGAVKKFQAANGISPVSGYVGPLTRATLNTICSSSAPVTTTNPSTNGSGVVSNNIPVSVLVQGQSGAKLGEFVVSGNGMVTNITLQRTGLSNNTTLQNVYLYDGATRLTDSSSVRTDGSISFNASSGLFAVSGSKTITVKADIASANTSGQTVGVALTGVTMMGGTMTPVTGVQGPLFSISSANTATAFFPTATPNPSAAAINAGSMNQTLWSNSISIGTNPANLKGFTIKQVGSAPTNALANVQLYVDGVSKGTASINNMSQYVFNMMATPAYLTTGSHLIEVRGDIVAGSNRSFYMTLERGTDIVIEDSTLPGVNVCVSATAACSSTVSSLTNMGNASNQITINSGTLTITQDPTFNNTTNLVGGASNIALAKFKMTAYGEDVKFISLPVTITGTSCTPTCASGSIANVGLYINGAQVGSNINPLTLSAGGVGTYTFTGLSNLYIPAGQSAIVEVRVDTSNGSSVAYTAGQLVVALGAGTAQGVSSSNTFTSSTASGQTLTIGNNVNFGATSGFSASSKAPNTTGVKIGSFTIQAGSAEGVTVTNLNVTLTSGVNNTMVAGNQLSNLTIKDGSTVVGTPTGNPVAGANNFSANITVPQSSTKVFDVYADFGSGASTLTVQPSMLITYRGNTSNQTGYTNSNAVLAGSITTAGAASIIAGGVTFNSGLSPVAQNVVAGATNFAIGTFNVKVNNAIAGAILQDLTFTVPANTVTSVMVNGKSGSVVGTTATVYGVGLTVPADSTGVNIPVTVGFACVGTANGCTANSPVTANVTLTTITYNNGTTVVSLPTSSPVTNSMYIVGSKPTLTVNGTQQTGLVVNAENKVGEVTIAADAAGQVKVNTVTFAVTSTNLGSPTYTFRLADGNTTISNATCTTSAVCTFTGGYAIPAGSSKTFSLYGTMSSGVPVASTVVSVSSSVTTAGFNWDDSLGGGTSLTGANIYNFPTNSYSIRQ